jgi:hypothetical protein
MTDDDRLRRPEPERTGPNRSFAGVFKNDPWAGRDDFWHRRNGSTGSHNQESDNTQAQSFDDRTASFDSAAASFSNVAQQAVDLAYRISEPYLRAGLRAAEAYTARESGTRNNFESPFQGGEAMNQPYGDPMTQMYGQLARAYAEFMVSLARAAYGAWYPPASPYGAYPRRRGWSGPYDGSYDQSGCYPPPPSYCATPPPPPSYCATPPSPPPYRATPRQGTRIEIKIDPLPARRWAKINKQLHQYSEHPQLKWLRHTEDDNVKLVLAPASFSNGIVTITVNVADDTLVGMYAGPITDTNTHHIIGNVTIEITART